MLYRSQFSTNLYQTCYQVPGDVITYCFGGNLKYPCPPKRKWNFTIAPMENSSNVKYRKNGKRYDVRLKGGQIGNQTWSFDWHYDP